VKFRNYTNAKHVKRFLFESREFGDRVISRDSLRLTDSQSSDSKNADDIYIYKYMKGISATKKKIESKN